VPHPRGGSTIPKSFTLRCLPKTRCLGSLGFCKSITTSWQSRLAAFFSLHNEIDFHIIGAHVTTATKIILLLQKGKLFESFKLRYPVHKTMHLISSWENICTVLFNWLLQAKAKPKGGGRRLGEPPKAEFTRWAASLQLSSWLYQSRGRTTKIDADLDPSVLNLSKRTTNDLRLL